MEIVKKDIVDFGVCKQNETLDIVWELTADPKTIVHLVPDCGCTAGIHVDPEHNVIRATFTEDDAKGLSVQQKTDWYPSGKIPISKTITVYLRDEHDLVVLDENNKTQFNPEKTTVKIGFVGKCIYDSITE